MILLIIALIILIMCRRKFKLQRHGISAKAVVSKKDVDVPASWDWRSISQRDSEMWQQTFNTQLAPGIYTSYVFNQHASGWCGACYLVATVQMIEDRLHVALGKADPSSYMQPTFQFNMQLALDTFNDTEKKTRDDKWNACLGGFPLRVLQMIKIQKCVLRLEPKKLLWLGYPNEHPSNVLSQIAIDKDDVIQNVDEEVMRRIFEYGPVVLGINSLCLRDPTIEKRNGVIDETIVAKRDHAVSVVGWTTKESKKCWIVRNSWGSKSVPSARPDKECVGTGYNICNVTFEPLSSDAGYAFVPFRYAGIVGLPSPWFEANPRFK